MRTARATLIAATLFLAAPHNTLAAKLQPQNLKAWDTYVQLTEKRIDSELASTSAFLRTDFAKPDEASVIRNALKKGQVYVKKLNTPDHGGREIKVPDGMIHHWFGAIFVPNMKLEPLLSWIRKYDDHQRFFKEVEGSKLLSQNGETFKIFLRFVRTKVVTVRYNTEHTAVYHSHGPDKESSRSFTTKIAEVKDPGTSQEKEAAIGDDSGYLWRLNSYWRFKEQDGGVIVECESISLSRSIPFGLGWLIKGFVESLPQESLESTLTGIRDRIPK